MIHPPTRPDLNSFNWISWGDKFPPNQSDRIRLEHITFTIRKLGMRPKSSFFIDRVKPPTNTYHAGKQLSSTQQQAACNRPTSTGPHNRNEHAEMRKRLRRYAQQSSHCSALALLPKVLNISSLPPTKQKIPACLCVQK